MARPLSRLRGPIVALCITAGVPTIEAAEVNYSTQVKPLLAARCYACHGALKQKGGLRLDTSASAIKGGKNGPAIIKGDPAASELIVRVSTRDIADRMPPEHEGEPLTASQIALLRDWIAAGAPHPVDEQPEPDARDHWAFRPIARPPIPIVHNRHWVKNPIDAFVAQKHHEFGLTPQSEAPRAVLLRRLSLDLIGLPPTPEEIAAVLADQRPDWYERTVKRLLDDPRHGERWARHWMDIWRYSDWWGLGNELRNSQKHIWHWRDWIIESLNQDTAYDEMVRLMLAADELHPNDLGRLRATGFLARNYFLFNRHQWMDETVEHVSKAFLGLTMNCARCHDHKFDPLPQDDYYRMRAFFEPYHARLEVAPGQADLEQNGIPRVFDARLTEPTYRFIRGDEKNPDKTRVMPPGVPAIISPELPEIKPVELPAESWQPQRREWVIPAYIAAMNQKLTLAKAALTTAENKLAAARNRAEQTATQRGDSSSSRHDANRAANSIIADDFSTLDQSRWQLFGGDWKHSVRRLEQKRDGATRAVLRFRGKVPRDFDATLRFTVLGGSQWRSVGICFDAPESDPTKDSAASYQEQNVYVSAFAGGPKIQASYNQSGIWHYPPAPSVRGLPIRLNREYTLRLQVRGQLINASINGEPVLACTTPLARRDGVLQLMTFDAIAAFHEVRVGPLDRKFELRRSGSLPADNSPLLDLESLDADVRVAAAAVSLAQAELTATIERGNAWRAIWAMADAATQQATRAAAIRAERAAAVARADHALAIAERDRRRAAADKQADVDKSITSARRMLEQAMASVNADIKPTETLPEFVGARWTPTRFMSSGADDPAPPFPARSSGRRSALATWITDPRNPLTARVAVNHIWTRHFGTPLIATVFDFGRHGQLPSHPELLDWLAREFIDSGWSMKHLHRLIVESATYRMSSSIDPANVSATRDADNRFWWRRTPIRLESQVVRDSLLSLAGSLDPTIGGPSILSAEQTESKRRSIYFFHSNNERNLFLTMFDEALVTDCYRRDQSIVPQQALAMTNSRLVLEQSRPIAERIAQQLQHSGGTNDRDSEFILAAFQILLASEPTNRERDASRRSLVAWRQLPEAGTGDAAELYARANLVWVLLNHNDFITIR